MKKLVLIVTLSIFFVFGVSETIACSCTQFLNVPESIKRANAVFVGKVTETLVEKREWKIKVSSVIKGNVFEIVELGASGIETSCEMSYFKPNETYLFFVTGSETFFSPQACTKTTEINRLKSKEYVLELRKMLTKEGKPLTKEAEIGVNEFEKDMRKIQKELLKAIEKGKKPKKLVE